MAVPKTLKGRYEIREVLGKGGMGVVYKAYDTVIKRDVALKTILDIADQKALELFHKEYEVLGSISHPNIVEIFDLGEFEEEGEKMPYFVMPLLSGMTLDRIIRTASHRLTVDRSVDIIAQTCRGLQAAHERALVHRDMKPSNVFVMDDDAVKIIDFGVVHKADVHSTKGLKGTLLYMPPEAIELKPPTPLSDIFSLGVVAYEMLTQRKPFDRPSQYEIIQAILHQIPPPASDLNSAVSQVVSRVIHKAMAKQPYHRFSSAREFADTLQKALRGEPIEIFDSARIQPRIERATKAFEQGDYQFAGEILSELEAEGHIDPAMSLLRRQLEHAVRQKRVQQLLDSARTRYEEKEYPLALQKVQQVLELEPAHAPALALKKDIEQKRTQETIEDWFRLVRQHLDNHAYSHARQALDNVLKLRPHESRARQLLAEVDRLEEDYLALRQEKEDLYKAAQAAWHKGEVSSALIKLERAMELDRKAPDSAAPERGATYQNFYNQVRSEHDAMNTSYAEARKYLDEHDFAQALAVCDTYLSKYPGHALFQALKFDIEEQQRQELSRFIAEVDRQVDAEPDLDKRVNLLKDALAQYPGEAHFERSLRIMREKRDLVSSIVAKAQFHEEKGQFVEALGQWEILQTIYSQYPGLNFEMDRVVKRRLQQERTETKARSVGQIDRHLHSGNFASALNLLKRAKEEFPDDAELAELEKLATQGMERTEEALRLLEQGREHGEQRRFAKGIGVLRKARELDEANPAIRAALVDTLAEHAKALLDKDWRAAETLVLQALELDPSHALGKSLRMLALDRKRDEFVEKCTSQARQLQVAGDIVGALRQVNQGLATYPGQFRLKQVKGTLERELQESRRRQARRNAVEELGRLSRELEGPADAAAVKSLAKRLRAIAGQYPDDAEVRSLVVSAEGKLESAEERIRTVPASSPAAPPPSPQKPSEPPAVKPEGAPPVSAAALTEEKTLIFRGIPATAKPPEAPEKPSVPAQPAPPPAPPAMPEAVAVPPPPPRKVEPLKPSAPRAAAKPSPRPPAPPAKQPFPAKPAARGAEAPPGGQTPPPVPPQREPPAAAPSRPPSAEPEFMRETVIRKRPVIPTEPPSPPPPPPPARAATPAATPAAAPAVPAPAEPAAAAAKPSRAVIVAVVAVVVLVAIAAGVFLLWRRKKQVVAGPTVAVTVRTSPAGATVLVNGEPRGTSELQLDLAPGTYEITAQADGYQTALAQADVKLGASPAFDLTLQPLPVAAHVYTDLERGEVRLDGESLGQLQEGQFTLESVKAGQHSLEVTGGRGSAMIAFEAKPAASPVIVPPVEARELKAILVSSLGSHAHVVASYGPLPVLLDGQPAGDLGPEGVDLDNLARGSHELTLGEGPDQRKILIDAGPAPALSAFLNSDRNVGTLVVVTGEDGVRVLLNGKEQRRATRRGQLRIPNLDVRGYSVEVVKEGYQTLPAQRAEVRKGEETKVEFHLAPLPKAAALAIRGGIPGTQVVVDRHRVGTIGANGTFSVSNLTPLEHTIELSKESYKSKRLTRQFTAGETVELTGSDVSLEAAMGTLQINRFPPESVVTITGPGETQPRPVSETTLRLPEGVYKLSATAANYSPGTAEAQVVAGQTRMVDLRLTGEKKSGISLWENPDRWTRDGKWYVRRGGGFALCGVSPAAGRFLFTVVLRRGNRLQWVADQTDERNYVLFQIEKGIFTRSLVRNGATKELARVPLSFASPGYYTLQVRVAAGIIAHQIFDGKNWIMLDSWTEPGQDFSRGKFGFLIPGNDEVGITNFSYTPQ
jgi:serine/threonine protein kinase